MLVKLSWYLYCAACSIFIGLVIDSIKTHNNIEYTKIYVKVIETGQCLDSLCTIKIQSDTSKFIVKVPFTTLKGQIIYRKCVKGKKECIWSE